MRSEEEINRQIEAGKKFVEKHPVSIFGDDNKKQFSIFLKIIEKARRGETARQIEDFADDAYEDENDHSQAFAVINWLFYEEEQIYDEEE